MKNRDGVSGTLEKTRLVVLALAIVAGVLLIVSGTRGPMGIYETILKTLPMITKDPLILSVGGTVALVFITLSSLGGFTVILGGFLVYRNHVGTGKWLMSIGAGFGRFSLILLVIAIVLSGDLSIVTSEYSPIGWVGIILSFVARTIAK